MGSTGKLSVLILALLAFVATCAGSGGRLTRAEASGGAQKKKSAGREMAAAKVLYTQNCTRCHGADGRAATPMGKAFAATNFTDANWWKRERPSDKRLTTSIREGRDDMPPFGDSLSKKEIAALAAYVRTFKGK